MDQRTQKPTTAAQTYKKSNGSLNFEFENIKIGKQGGRERESGGGGNELIFELSRACINTEAISKCNLERAKFR